MDLLATLEHRDELDDFSGSRFRFLGGLNAPQDGVAVGLIECFEERSCARIRVQSGLEIGRNGRSCRGVISGVPAAVALRPFDSSEAGCLHRATFDEG